ncbi:hypothetical protein Vadar_028385 [Vaccinium darrowii]|uniref:Uncharacterized protein n=1 Tax=Vaccinium darrowii TaxID=229202 RepID=A0ACB7ZM65_9ERIC|nr:hypothetical protein Vadar_028385 [Vaccinium darrowii]
MATRVDIPPVNYTFKVQAMSTEKLRLAAEFTIGGPRTDDNDSILKFSELISAHDNELLQGIIESETRVVTNSMTMEDIFKRLQGIIESETRVVTNSMTMEDIFKDTKDFLQKVSDKVQLQLNQFGLRIYDAKVEQLVDGQKTQMEAADQARVLTLLNFF